MHFSYYMMGIGLFGLFGRRHNINIKMKYDKMRLSHYNINIRKYDRRHLRQLIKIKMMYDKRRVDNLF